MFFVYDVMESEGELHVWNFIWTGFEPEVQVVPNTPNNGVTCAWSMLSQDPISLYTATKHQSFLIIYSDHITKPCIRMHYVDFARFKLGFNEVC